MLGQEELPILLPFILPLLQPLQPWAPLLLRPSALPLSQPWASLPLLMPLLWLLLLLLPDWNSCGACPLGGGGGALELRHGQMRRRTAGGAHWTG